MRRFLLALVLLLPCSVLLAAYPYDSICEIRVKSGGNGYVGGSATLVAVSEDMALLLTAKHVVSRAGNEILVHWAATGEQSTGVVLKVADDIDIAMCLCPRPHGLIPVPVTVPVIGRSGPITNAGFPGLTGTLEWQTGNITSLSRTILEYDVRPIPGMSGGATFDKYGNLVGVIIYYYRSGGGSTSGQGMYNFLHRFLAKATLGLEPTPVSFDEPLPAGDPEVEIWTPEQWDKFTDYILFKYGVITKEPVPDLAEPEVAPSPPPKQYHKRHCPPKPKWRLFRGRF